MRIGIAYDLTADEPNRYLVQAEIIATVSAKRAQWSMGDVVLPGQTGRLNGVALVVGHGDKLAALAKACPDPCLIVVLDKSGPAPKGLPNRAKIYDLAPGACYRLLWDGRQLHSEYAKPGTWPKAKKKAAPKKPVAEE